MPVLIVGNHGVVRQGLRHHIVTLASNHRNTGSHIVKTHVQHMLDVLERSYAGHVTLDTLGRALDRQPTYLGHLFRKETGMTVRGWVTELRLDHAAKLLHSGVAIEEVSLLVGYRSKKNFYRQFRRKYGMTPLEFGRRSRAGAEPRSQAAG